jgi:hypothetical protein
MFSLFPSLKRKIPVHQLIRQTESALSALDKQNLIELDETNFIKTNAMAIETGFFSVIKEEETFSD